MELKQLLKNTVTSAVTAVTTLTASVPAVTTTAAALGLTAMSATSVQATGRGGSGSNDDKSNDSESAGVGEGGSVDGDTPNTPGNNGGGNAGGRGGNSTGGKCDSGCGETRESSGESTKYACHAEGFGANGTIEIDGITKGTIRLQDGKNIAWTTGIEEVSNNQAKTCFKKVAAKVCAASGAAKLSYTQHSRFFGQDHYKTYTAQCPQDSEKTAAAPTNPTDGAPILTKDGQTVFDDPEVARFTSAADDLSAEQRLKIIENELRVGTSKPPAVVVENTLRYKGTELPAAMMAFSGASKPIGFGIQENVTQTRGAPRFTFGH